MNELKNLSLDLLESNPWNREHFSPASLRELISSIRHLGLMEPLIVRRLNAPDGLERYEIASGHRRWLAAREAGLKEVPCWVKELSDEEVQDMNLVTNLQREDISVLERARMIQARMEAGGLTQEEMAIKLGKERSWVAKMTSVLNLHPEVIEALKEMRVALRPLLALRTLPPDQQRQLVQEVKERQTSPEGLERRVRQLSGKPTTPVAVAPVAEAPAPQQEIAPMPLPKDIKIYAIRRVLLKGHWFEVETGSFQVHPYRYAVKEAVVHAGGDGFSFMQQGGTRVAGPLASIEAVLCDEE